MYLENNTILITGGTSGIGYELGKALLEKNNKVILLGRKKNKLETLHKTFMASGRVKMVI